MFFEGIVRVGATCCNKLNRGRKAAADGLRREGKNGGVVRQAGHRITKHIHEKRAMETQDGGGIAVRGGGVFSDEEIQLLRGLPAVANVTRNRITYSDAFKQVCTIRYLAGESPTKIFREAGLPPELIGYKRIERSVARWKAAVLKSVNGSSNMSNGEIITELVNLYVHAVTRKEKLDDIAGIVNPDKANIGNAPHPLDGANVSGRGCISADVPVPSGAAAIAVPPAPLSADNGLDSETALVIIKQQARRIDELERANASLLDKLNKAIPSPTVDN